MRGHSPRSIVYHGDGADGRARRAQVGQSINRLSFASTHPTASNFEVKRVWCTTLHHSHSHGDHLAKPRWGEVIVLLTIAAAWLLLLVLVLGMFQVATSTPTPQPVSAAPFTLPGNNVAPAAGPGPTKEADHAAEPMSAEAA